MGVRLASEPQNIESLAHALEEWSAARASELSLMKLAVQRQEREVGEAKEQLKAKQEELEDQNRYNNELRSENIECHSQITRLRQELNELEVKDRQSEKMSEELRLKTYDLKIQIDTLQRREVELINEVDKLSYDRARLESLLGKAESDLEERTRVLEATKRESKSRLAALSKSECELDHAQREIRALQEDIAVRDIANAALTQTVEKMKQRTFFSRLINQD